MAKELYEMSDRGALCLRAAQLIKDAGRQALQERGRFNLVLTGGSTVQPLYRYLAERAFTPEFLEIWRNTDFFLGDERWVPRDDPDSNGGMVNRLLLGPARIPEDRIMLIPTGVGGPADGAGAYENTLRGYFADGMARGVDMPQFDLVLLSLGDDGHVASLFPDSKVLGESEKWVAVSHPSGLGPSVSRITMTLPLLNRARLIIIMAAGEKKANLARRIMEEPSGGASRYPAGMIDSTRRSIWLLADN